MDQVAVSPQTKQTAIWRDLGQLVNDLLARRQTQADAGPGAVSELYQEHKRLEMLAVDCLPWHSFPDKEVVEGKSSFGDQVVFWMALVIAFLIGISTSFGVGVVVFLIAAVGGYWLKAHMVEIGRRSWYRIVIAKPDGFLEGSNTPNKLITIQEGKQQALSLNTQWVGFTRILEGDLVLLIFGGESTPIGIFVVGNDRSELYLGDSYKSNCLNKNALEACQGLRAQFGSLCERIQQQAVQTITIDGSKIQLAKLEAAWRDIIVEPAIEEQLLRAIIHFACGAPSAPRGILLKGPPGTGKSLIANTLGCFFPVRVFQLSISSLKSKWVGETGINVSNLWQDARAEQAAIIFIDECEGAFAKRGSEHSDSFTNDLVQNFLTQWDGIGQLSRILVVGATNRADLIDDAIMSRFTDVIDLQPVGESRRADLAHAVARQSGYANVLPESFLKNLGGMSGREIRNTIQYAVRTGAPGQPTAAQFEAAIAKIRGKVSTRTDVRASWDNLILDEKIKRPLMTLTHMLREAEAYEAKGLPVARALLLYGPPGTGKTQIARTLAQEAGVSFIAKTTADLKGQYLGQAAARVADTFQSARANSPCLLFIDEIDSLTPARGGSDSDALTQEALSQFLQEMDGIEAQSGFVLVVAATNRRDQMDQAILSRFNKMIEISLPTAAERLALLEGLLKNKPVAPGLNLGGLGQLTDGFSGRDLRELITAAFGHAVDRNLAAGGNADTVVLTAVDFNLALSERGVAVDNPMIETAPMVAASPEDTTSPMATPSVSKFCHQCGTPTKTDSRFCANCGTSIQDSMALQS